MLATKKWYLLEYLSSEGSLLIHEGLVTVVLWGLLYVILLTLFSFAFNVPIGNMADNFDLSALEGILFDPGNPPGQFRPLVVPSGLFVLLLFHEYLRGHIGEKRPDGSNQELKNSQIYAQKTALSSSAVFCMFPVALFQRAKGGRSASFWAKILIDLRR